MCILLIHPNYYIWFVDTSIFSDIDLCVICSLLFLAYIYIRGITKVT